MKTWVVLALFLLSVGTAEAASAVLSWEYKEDPKLKIKGFRVYYGKNSRKSAKAPSDEKDETNAQPYDKIRVVNNPKTRRVTLKGLSVGRWYFRMVTVAESEAVSLFSQEISGDIRNLGPPTNIKLR